MNTSRLRSSTETAQTLPSSSRNQHSAIDINQISLQDDKGEGIIQGVLFLQYFCQKYKLPSLPQYTVTEESGPSHAKICTVQVVLGIHKVSVTSTTKKQAQNLAAYQLYIYLNEKIQSIDHLQEKLGDVILKQEKLKSENAAKLYSDIQYGPSILSQLEDYDSALKNSIDIKKRIAALEILNEYVNIKDPEDIVEKALNALGLKFEWQILPRVDNKETHILEIGSPHPTASLVSLNAMILPDRLRGATAMETITYLKKMLS